MRLKNTDRTVAHQAGDLKQLIAELGRLRPLRDPLSDLGHQGEGSLAQLTAPQLHCVLWLGLDGALSSRVIAERIGCGQPTVTGVVDRLEKIGLVERTRDTQDRRVVHVTLTAAGKKIYGLLDAVFEQRLGLFLALMSEKDRGLFLRIMGSVVGSLRAVVAHEVAS